MKIKKLQIYGFKTFVSPTEILFHEGVTSVVGPNGCGKSNIIDALRWVMGEKSAKGLRGDSMEDVIFSGCASRKALNFAEVTLTLTDVEGKLPKSYGNYHEIAVTRRLHRSGDSEYLINKVPCRLRDIIDLFLDTGLGKRAYSIVEQGRIDAILSTKPLERRFLIEEAAGLSKYRARRDESLLKMKQTGENLERLNDIIGEIRREMTALKRQAGRARGFKELCAEKRLLEKELMASAWLALEERLSAARAAHEEIRLELARARAESDKLGVELETRRLSLVEEEKKIEESQRILYNLKNQITEREGRTAFLEKEAENLLIRSARSAEEAGELDDRVRATVAELEELRADTANVEESLQEMEARLEEVADLHQVALEERRIAHAELEARKNAVFTSMNALSRVNSSLDHTLRQEKEAERKLEYYARQDEEIAQKLQELNSEASLKKRDLSTATKELDQASEERERLEEDNEDLAFERQTLARRVEELNKKLHSNQSRLKSLEELKNGLECYGQGVRTILRHARDEKWVGLRGVVADLLTVPQKFETALEAALGERLQYVVVADAAQAVDCVAVLKDLCAGRSTFVPADIKEAAAVMMPTLKQPWAHGPLLDLVKVAQGGERVARTLLGGFYVVDTIDHAIELWRSNQSGATFVTLEGDTLTAEGVMTGGASANDAGLLKRNREIGELHAEVGETAAKLGETEDELGEVASRHEETTARLEFVKEEAHRLELQVAQVTSHMAQFEERREHLKERRETLEFERDVVMGEAARLSESAKKLEAERVALIRQTEAQEESRLGFEEAVRKADNRAEALQAEQNRLRVESASDKQRREGLLGQVRSLERTMEMTRERSARLKTEAAELQKEHSRKLAEKGKTTIELDVLVKELEKSGKLSDELLSGLDEKRSQVALKEKDSQTARRVSEEVHSRLIQVEISVREGEVEARALAERFAERLEGDILEAAREGVSEGFDAASAKQKISSLDEKIRSYGEVNLLADQEYEERRIRFDFMEKQRLDLEESLGSLKSAIQHINKVSRERFEETFNTVNEKFKEVFPTLFRGGEAELSLTDPENLLETGIDIIARPPGKRPQHMSLLSGGEKALTAVALIFSLFLVKSSPFCVLDEVDAPLDDANVERFTELLRQMAGTSQFLVITHNKITMEAAAHLYGVTMEEPGVSNLVSVRLMEPFSAVEVA